MELSKLFVTASIPVLKVLLITALGSFLALDSVNILGEDARKHLNNVSCSVLRFYGSLSYLKMEPKLLKCIASARSGELSVYLH